MHQSYFLYLTHILAWVSLMCCLRGMCFVFCLWIINDTYHRRTLDECWIAWGGSGGMKKDKRVSPVCRAAWFVTFTYHYCPQSFTLRLLPLFPPWLTDTFSFSQVVAFFLSLSLSLSLSLQAGFIISTLWIYFPPLLPSLCSLYLFNSCSAFESELIPSVLFIL